MFHLGQKVVCIKDFVGEYYDGALPKGGQIYTIRGFQHIKDLVGLLLEEIVSEPIDWAIIGCPELGVTEPGWDHRGFRPVDKRKTDIAVFTRMCRRELQPA